MSMAASANNNERTEKLARQMALADRKLSKIAQKKRQVNHRNPRNKQAKLERLERLEHKWSSRKAWLEKKQNISNDESIEPILDLELYRECVICMESDRDATIVHGETAHIACCFECAKNVQSSTTPQCPICNLNIDLVVRHYYA